MEWLITVFYFLATLLPIFLLKRFTSSTERRFNAFALGGWISLTISFFVGNQLVFYSISSVFGLIAAWIFYLAYENWPKNRKKWGAILFSIGCVGQCAAALAITLQVPRAPGFYWTAENGPQIPATMAVPINAPADGRWVMAGAQYALLTAEVPTYMHLRSVSSQGTSHSEK